MDRHRYSWLAHRGHRFCSPVSPHKADELLSLLELSADQRVLDVGCGKAEWLIRTMERCPVHGVGLDVSRQFLDEARAEAARRLPERQPLLLELDASDHVAERPYDAAICVGSTHALAGGYREALRRLTGLTRPGAALIVGEGYWRREPAAEYLEASGIPRQAYTEHHENIRIAEELGLTPLYSFTASDDDWDRYEGLYGHAIETWAAENPADPDRDAMLQRSRAWSRLYQRWGRGTLGFGVYLFRRA